MIDFSIYNKRNKVKKISLVENLNIQARPEHLERLRIIDTEDFSGVKRKVREILAEKDIRVDDDYIERGVDALKLYYAIPLIDPRNAHAISSAIDPFWHAHMLHSKQYTQFCERVFGEYLHHEPLNKTLEPLMVGARRLYSYTVEVLGKSFAHLDKTFWASEPTNARLICFHMRVHNPTIWDIALFEESPRGMPVA